FPAVNCIYNITLHSNIADVTVRNDVTMFADTTEVERSLASYLESISGGTLRLESPPPGGASKLPLFLRKRYRLAQTRLFGRDLTLAFEAEGRDPGTVSEYSAHAERLGGAFGTPVALV